MNADLHCDFDPLVAPDGRRRPLAPSLRWTPALAVGLLLVAPMLIGCHRAETEEQQAAAPTVAPAPSSAEGDKQDSPKSASSSISDDLALSDEVATKPKEVEPAERTATYDNGAPQARWREIVYSDGSKVNDGLHQEFYRNGQISVDGQYKMGKKDGVWKLYNENGSDAGSQTFLDGKPDGVWTYKRPDGTLDRQEAYKKGKKNGDWIYYDKTGKLPIRQRGFKNDNLDGLWLDTYAPGKKSQEIHLKDGKKDGLTIQWYENGQKAFEGSFKMGQPDGKITLWDPKGKKTKELEFDNGKVLTAGASADDVVLPVAPKDEGAKGGADEKKADAEKGK